MVHSQCYSDQPDSEGSDEDIRHGSDARLPEHDSKCMALLTVRCAFWIRWACDEWLRPWREWSHPWRVITPVIAPNMGLSRLLKSVITQNGVITPMVTLWSRILFDQSVPLCTVLNGALFIVKCEHVKIIYNITGNTREGYRGLAPLSYYIYRP